MGAAGAGMRRGLGYWVGSAGWSGFWAYCGRVTPVESHTLRFGSPSGAPDLLGAEIGRRLGASGTPGASQQCRAGATHVISVRSGS